ncbi:hypothetical protein BUALT_Bualt19G0085700 [Buddleja alternifolia]|uniref:UPF3 domain-containing protein n=1 Tax=Buddleja alternifolia TaxID=168488 RepID=A0AAV6W210_9LAMI|nr:hypothetical protein BUALT_Bualt19G0085700 [Buddleja alternifolia]
MKGPLDRTKVVLRHLPPTITQFNLVEHVDSRFSGRYHWLVFRPGKSGQKHLTYSRAYIDFNKPEDVIEFAEFFNGHVFVNEKGTQFKAIVEYAPSQRVPKLWSKKDGREGTILKDPEYLEFLEFIAKPVENLPSAEIQLERKEAERAGAPKDAPIVTPLMDYVRQKRAAKGGARRTMLSGKSTRRVSVPSRGAGSVSSRRGSEKRTTMYVLRDSSKGVSSKEKSTYLVVPKQDDQPLTDKSANSAALHGTDALEGETGGAGSTGIGKKKILLLKGKEKEIPNVWVKFQNLWMEKYILVSYGTKMINGDILAIQEKKMPKQDNENRENGLLGKYHLFILRDLALDAALVSGGSSLQQNATTPARTSHGAAPLRQNQRREASGRIIRSILVNRDTRQNQPSSGSQSEIRIQTSNQDRDKRPPRPPNVQSFQKGTNGAPEDKVVNNDHPAHSERQERRTRNKDRPDRGVWTPLRRSDGSHASDDSLSSSASQTSQVVDSEEGTHAEMKQEMLVTRGGEYRPVGSGRGGHYPVDNGSYRHGGRRGSTYNNKDADSSLVIEGKPSKRGGSSSYGPHEEMRLELAFADMDDNVLLCDEQMNVRQRLGVSAKPVCDVEDVGIVA